MDKRPLGTSGLEVSVVGLGCSNFGGRTDAVAAKAVIHRALDCGITFFDTADVYGNGGGSELCLGDALGDRRKDIVLATKFGRSVDHPGTSRRSVLGAAEASLRRLRTDWIDLYQIHWPAEATPIEETLRALDDLVRQGKVRAIGTSNFSDRQTIEAAETARACGLVQHVSSQNEYSLLSRGVETSLLPTLHKYGISLLPYLPLAGGLLSGKYRQAETAPAGSRFSGDPVVTDAFVRGLTDRFLTDATWRRVEQLDAFASARGRSLIELAVSWLAVQPSVASIIIGATQPGQIEQNITAARWPLTPSERDAIDRITGPA
jgi:aryl-alcohol dehydrogenase-like predicted oxidoreductase